MLAVSYELAEASYGLRDRNYVMAEVGYGLRDGNYVMAEVGFGLLDGMYAFLEVSYLGIFAGLFCFFIDGELLVIEIGVLVDE
jgi:hypothetical protein